MFFANLFLPKRSAFFFLALFLSYECQNHSPSLHYSKTLNPPPNPCTRGCPPKGHPRPPNFFESFRVEGFFLFDFFLSMPPRKRSSHSSHLGLRAFSPRLPCTTPCFFCFSRTPRVFFLFFPDYYPVVSPDRDAHMLHVFFFLPIPSP